MHAGGLKSRPYHLISPFWNDLVLWQIKMDLTLATRETIKDVTLNILNYVQSMKNKETLNQKSTKEKSWCSVTRDKQTLDKSKTCHIYVIYFILINFSFIYRNTCSWCLSEGVEYSCSWYSDFDANKNVTCYRIKKRHIMLKRVLHKVFYANVIPLMLKYLWNVQIRIEYGNNLTFLSLHREETDVPPPSNTLSQSYITDSVVLVISFQ